MNIENLVKKTLDVVLVVEKTMIIFVMAGMALLLIAEVFGREVLGHGFYGSSNLAIYMMIWSAYLGFSLAVAEGVHMRPRFTDGWLPAKWAPNLMRIGNFVSGSIFLYMVWASYEFVRGSYEFGETAPTLGWPTWPIQMIMPLAFLLGGLRHLSRGFFPRLSPVYHEVTP